MGMPAKVKLPSGAVLSISNIEWTSEERPDIAEELNRDIKSGIAAAWRPGYIPDPDHVEAQRVAKLLDGKVIEEIFDERPVHPGA